MVISSAETNDIHNRFVHHAPSTERAQAHAHARKLLLDVAMSLAPFIPPGREKSLMFTHLEEAMFWANAAIARKEE